MTEASPPIVFPTQVAATSEAARDIDADVLTALRGSHPLLISEVQREVQASGDYIAMGPVEAALGRLMDAGLVDRVMLGDPPMARYRVRVHNSDLMATVCMEIADLPALNIIEPRSPRACRIFFGMPSA